MLMAATPKTEVNTTSDKQEGSVSRICYQDVSKSFKLSAKAAVSQGATEITAVKNVHLNIQDGEVVALIGPSGCGKSTLLNMGAGLYPPTAGKVFVDGIFVDSPNRHVAFMLQKDLLLPWRTIRQNTEVGLEIRNVEKATRRDRALALLEKVHLSGFADHYPHQLSGGMRQRAALARTLAVDPSVLLMDEPFSALDAQTKIILQQDLAVSLFEEKKTALLITHDLAEAVALSDRIVVMSARPGTIIKEIIVDVPERNNPLVRRQNHQPMIGEYIAELMQLLHLDEVSAQAEI